jgi:hypothetical protein
VNTPNDDSGQAASVGLTSDEIAHAPLIETAGVVDDEYVAARRRSNPFQEHIRAPGMPCRTRASGDSRIRNERFESVRSNPHRQLELDTRVGDERRGPVESIEERRQHAVSVLRAPQSSE